MRSETRPAARQCPSGERPVGRSGPVARSPRRGHQTADERSEPDKGDPLGWPASSETKAGSPVRSSLSEIDVRRMLWGPEGADSALPPRLRRRLPGAGKPSTATMRAAAVPLGPNETQPIQVRRLLAVLT
jgi:hypothetical protein